MSNVPQRAALRPPSEPRREQSRLDRLVERSRRALLWERAWPAIWLPLGVLCIFVTLAWLGVWIDLPPLARAVGCGLFGLAFLASLVPLLRLRLPSRRDALSRLDRSAASPHRPAMALEDTLALGSGDAAAKALWALHQRRAADSLAGLTVAPPAPQMTRRDPYALRGLAIVALAASAFVAGPELASRLTSAFDWRGLPSAGADVRIDGWIDPPLYTRLPPLILDFKSGQPAHVRVPVNSTLVLRAAGRSPLAVDTDAGLKELPPAQAGNRPTSPQLSEHRFTIAANADVSVRAGPSSGRLTVEAIPDKPPQIALVGQPQANARGSLTVTYTAKDDYGLASAEGMVERADGRSGRTLVEPPKLALALPSEAAGDGETKTTVDLSDSPWAGARVKLTLVARDEAGQTGTSATAIVTLPQRPFSKPLARALVEQRRDLIIEPEQRRRVQTALDALLIAPELFMPEPGVYLGLNFAADQLRQAKTDPDLLEVANYLWEMALQIEDGDLSDAEKALRAAQEAVRQGLERGAPEDEMRRLTDELRRALDRFVSEFAQRQQQNRDQAQDQRSDPNGRTVTPDDLKNMLNRIEELSRQGATAEAQRLLEELRNILENLRTARPGRQPNPMARELNRSLDELDNLMRDQQGLRDETYRNGQQRMPNSRSQQQQRRGEDGQRGGQRRAPGERGGQQQMGEGEQGPSPEELERRQQALRQRLENLQNRLKGLGMEGEQGLDDAGREMGDAQGSLGRGEAGDAVDSQGRALEAMRRGAQGLADQMQQQGNGNEQADGQDGEPGRPEGRAQGAEDTDPLGRPTRGRDWVDGRVKIPSGADATVARARRILEELRRRLGEPERPREELDYLERLLRPR
ncbi:TIGR02302 family protein [Chelatococcus reniformis]|uniref:TIGR02302 family protein n=1 Tax=Chelatococcus reniformis TaxID=1494448 RepID=A0A916TZ54_9HYPH|nr:TIGR02302 family protein [Chelatococcus reniformis]GGC46293.1 TIGR02302 family protein [Chelatococcus reniformis]